MGKGEEERRGGRGERGNEKVRKNVGMGKVLCHRFSSFLISFLTFLFSLSHRSNYQRWKG
jgi:hypothetical protein